MRIAVLADPIDTQSAGIYIYTLWILKGMTRIPQDNDYIVVRPQSGEAFPNSKELIIPIKSWIPMHARLRQIFSIPRAVAKEKVDIVFEPAHFGPFNLPKHIKRVTVIHDLTPIMFPEFHGSMSHWVQKLSLPRILRKADLVITVSESTRRDLIRLYPYTKDKSKTVLVGKDETFGPRKDINVLNKYNIQKPYFLTVSTLEPRKNIGLLVDAYHRFRAETGAEVQLVLAGKKGWNIDDLLQKIEQSPYREDIILTGFTEREEMPVLYTMCLGFVYPSWYEGFGSPVVEALSCGAVIAISNSSSLPEVGGDAALYFDPNSVSELTAHLKEIYSNEALREERSKLSLERAKLFSWEKAGRETKILLEELMSNE